MNTNKAAMWTNQSNTSRTSSRVLKFYVITDPKGAGGYLKVFLLQNINKMMAAQNLYSAFSLMAVANENTREEHEILYGDIS